MVLRAPLDRRRGRRGRGGGDGMKQQKIGGEDGRTAAGGGD